MKGGVYRMLTFNFYCSHKLSDLKLYRMQNYQKVVARLLLASHAVMYHPVKYRSLSAIGCRRSEFDFHPCHIISAFLNFCP